MSTSHPVTSQITRWKGPQRSAGPSLPRFQLIPHHRTPKPPQLGVVLVFVGLFPSAECQNYPNVGVLVFVAASLQSNTCRQPPLPRNNDGNEHNRSSNTTTSQKPMMHGRRQGGGPLCPSQINVHLFIYFKPLYSSPHDDSPDV